VIQKKLDVPVKPLTSTGQVEQDNTVIVVAPIEESSSKKGTYY